jgi:hypothetical protein
MTNYYYFLEQIESWEADLESEMASNKVSPSEEIINNIINYSMIVDVHSNTLNENISISLN